MSSPMKTEPIQVYEGNGVKPNGGPHPAKKVVLYCKKHAAYSTGDNAYTTDEMDYGPFNGLCEINGLNKPSLELLQSLSHELAEGKKLRGIDIVIHDTKNTRTAYGKKDIIRIKISTKNRMGNRITIYWWTNE